MRAQFQALPYPAREELIAIFERQSAEFAAAFDMENTDNFSVDQVAAVLYAWGRERGLNLRLGYLEQGASPLLVSHPNEDDDVLVVWVHNDGRWNGGIGHFSGIARWEVEMNEERTREERRGERSSGNGQISGVCESGLPMDVASVSSGQTQVDLQTCGLAVVDAKDQAMDDDEDDFYTWTE